MLCNAVKSRSLEERASLQNIVQEFTHYNVEEQASPILHLNFKIHIQSKVMKRTEYSVSLQTNVVITQKYNVTVNSEELIGTTEWLTL
jgi:hypothetical protein